MDRRVFLVPERVAEAMIAALDRAVLTRERVLRLRGVGYDEGDLAFEATSEIAEAWTALRAYAAERSGAGNLIVAVPVPDADEPPLVSATRAGDARHAR